MTEDLSDFKEPPKDKRTRCYYSIWFAEQSPELQDALSKAMANPRWKTQAIYDLVSKRGFEKQYNTLRMHRAGTCSC